MPPLCARYRVRELTNVDTAACVAFVEGLERRDLQSRFGGTSLRLSLLFPAKASDRDRKVFGAFGEAGALLGIANLEPIDRDDVEIAIIVRSDFKRRGAGLCLMSKAVETAREARKAQIVACVSPENKAARALLRKVGFRAVRGDGYAAEEVLSLC
jgi:RimJ/RimL family protein N-acetyltransferase